MTRQSRSALQDVMRRADAIRRRAEAPESPKENRGRPSLVLLIAALFLVLIGAALIRCWPDQELLAWVFIVVGALAGIFGVSFALAGIVRR